MVMLAFKSAYHNKSVLVTGHTGFKGAWLALWLQRLGARVSGYALAPEHERVLFSRAQMQCLLSHREADICDSAALDQTLEETRPQVIFHMAAQALVRKSYADPIGTLLSNVMGTAHVCEAVRRAKLRCAIVVISSDKCYENREWVHGYRENDPMGGNDPYSVSKGCAELVSAAWRTSFFRTDRFSEHGVALATARAGNVIGPGDWCEDRIVPDIIRAMERREKVRLRMPYAVRPWQHVLEPLAGYLTLGAALTSERGMEYCGGWNFGPLPDAWSTVQSLVDQALNVWGEGSSEVIAGSQQMHETHLLHLSIDKALRLLPWRPVWDLKTSIERTVTGYRNLLAHEHSSEQVLRIMLEEIEAYEQAVRH